MDDRPSHSPGSKEVHSLESKDGLARRSTVSNVLSPTGGNRVRAVNNSTTTNVINPRFGRIPDPLRCSPYKGEQFHEVINRDPNTSVFRRREDFEFANRRLSGPAGAAAALSSNGLAFPLQSISPTLAVPTQAVLPVNSELSAVEQALGRFTLIPILSNHVLPQVPILSEQVLPQIVITEADKGNLDLHGIDKENVNQLKIPPFNSPSTAQDSSTSSGGSDSRLKVESQNSLTKSHSILGIDLAGDTHGQENMNLFRKKKKNADESAIGKSEEYDLGNMKENGQGGITENGVGSKIEPKQQIDGMDSSSQGKAPPRRIFESRALLTDAPSMKVPSCVGLPRGWNSENDRCIAYLSTHAPLTANGHVPDQEATLERHSTEAISDFLIANFPKFQHLNKIPHWAIEKRLEMLDIKENEYFGVPYGGYAFTDWGKKV